METAEPSAVPSHLYEVGKACDAWLRRRGIHIPSFAEINKQQYLGWEERKRLSKIKIELREQRKAWEAEDDNESHD